jgi:hypothetical protein
MRRTVQNSAAVKYARHFTIKELCIITFTQEEIFLFVRIQERKEGSNEKEERKETGKGKRE